MKKVLLAAVLALGTLQAANAQTVEKKSKEELRKEQARQEAEDRKNAAKKAADERKAAADQRKKEAAEKAAARKQAAQDARDIKSGKKKAPEAPSVASYSAELPMEAFPYVREFVIQKNRDDKYAKLKDNYETRKQFYKSRHTSRGYLEVEVPNETRYARVQYYHLAKDSAKKFLVVENTDCKQGVCANDLKIYKNTAPKTWEDATATLMPEMPYKAISKMLKSEYKNYYQADDIYESKNLASEEGLKKNLLWQISSDEKRVLLRETGLNIYIYELVFNENNGKFSLKKLK